MLTSTQAASDSAHTVAAHMPRHAAPIRRKPAAPPHGADVLREKR
jgi:hypothetical protein